MGSETPRSTVGDYVTLVRGTTYEGQLVGKPGPALLGLGSIEPGGGFRTGDYKTYGGECPDKLMLRPGDIYASLKGATKDGKMIGSVARVPPSVALGRLTQDTVKLVFSNPNAEEASYLYWVLRTPQYREYCAGHAMGSAVVALSRRDFLSYPVPPLTPLRKTATALFNALEARIELNRRMSETLEEIARALFKSWFIDFDPVYAKAEGRKQRLPGNIAEIFSDRLVTSELGDIPERWDVGRLDSLFLLQRGFDLPSDRRSVGPYPVLAASGPDGNHSEYMARGPGVTTGRSGLLGKVFYVRDNFWPLNTSLWIKEFRHAPPAFAFYLLQTLDFKQFDGGSAVPTLNRNHVHGLPALLPPVNLVSLFEQMAALGLERQLHAQSESRMLAAIRDSLLSKLVSGEFRWKDAERFAEAVA